MKAQPKKSAILVEFYSKENKRVERKSSEPTRLLIYTLRFKNGKLQVLQYQPNAAGGAKVTARSRFIQKQGWNVEKKAWEAGGSNLPISESKKRSKGQKVGGSGHAQNVRTIGLRV